jgi:DNA-binding transcriptional LysR family regulator
MASRLLAPVEAFRQKHPELRVDLIMTDRRLDLAKGEAEVALRIHEPGEDQLIARRIANSPWAVFTSQSYIKRHGRPQRCEDLDQHAIFEFAGELADNHAARWLRSVAPTATIAIRGNSMLGVLAAVKSGAGLAPLPILLGGSEDGLERVLGRSRRSTRSSTWSSTRT